MKRILFLIIILIYAIIYNLILSKSGEIIIYIVNPIIWFIFTFIAYKYLLFKKDNKLNVKELLINIVIINSIVYMILYYTLGLLTDYTNNPYNTNINGIIINIFSILLVAFSKEFIRYKLINYKPIRYYKTYIILLVFLFTLIDINYLNIINSNNIFDIVVINIFNVLVANSFLSYLALKTGYKGTLLYIFITIMPTFIFSVVPKYNSFIIFLFDLIFYLITYVIIQYTIDKNNKEIYQKRNNLFYIKKIIMPFTLLFILAIFSIGLLPIKPVVILSGSMKPLINEGDLVIIKRSDINNLDVGDIIEYKLEDYYVVHRIVSINIKNNEKYIITKGDNNNEPDKLPVLEYQVTGKMEFLIPYIGYPTYLLKNIGNK